MTHQSRSSIVTGFTGAVAAVLVSAGAASAEVSITNHVTENMVCSEGVCSPTAKRAYLDVRDLQRMLKGSDVKVTTGSGAVTMGVDAPLSWTSKHRLTLDAIYNVAIKAPLTVAGPGALTVVYNDGGTGGDLKFFPGGKIDFWDIDSKLAVNGNTYTLTRGVTQLAKVANRSPTGFFALARDYDASADGAYPHSIIKTVKGVVEGLGHTIRNLTIATTAVQNTGFVEQIGRTGTVRDVILENATISSDGATGSYPMILGGLAAVNLGLIDGSHISGTVSGGTSYSLDGGLVGHDSGNGSIVNSSSAATLRVKGEPHVQDEIGGLVGYHLAGTIANSFATGAVVSANSAEAGGLAGFSRGVIVDSYATGAVTASDNYPAQDQYGAGGGLVGDNRGVIQASYATGAVVATGSSCGAGGLVGYHSLDVFSTKAAIEDAYALGSATGNVANCWVGGLAGVFISDGGATIATSYATGAVSGGIAGGFIGGSSSGGKSRNYWDTTTSETEKGCGDADCSGVTGLTNKRLKAQLPKGFDRNVWGQNPNINNGYPYLLANPPPQ